MPKDLIYPNIPFKDRDVNFLKSKFGDSEVTVSSKQDSSNKGSRYKKKFISSSSVSNETGEKSEMISVQKSKGSPSREKSKLKEYFYNETPEGQKQLQIRKQSSGGDERFRIIKGNRAERKFNRIKRRSNG